MVYKYMTVAGAQSLYQLEYLVDVVTVLAGLGGFRIEEEAQE